MNLDTIGYVLKTLRVDGEIFESGSEKKLRTQKYPDTCGQGLSPETKQQTSDSKRSKKQISKFKCALQ